jgi:hypothetical protein
MSTKSNSAITSTESMINAGVLPGPRAKVSAKIEEWTRPIEGQGLFTLKQAAQVSGYRSQYLRLLISEGAIPARKHAGVWFLTREVVEGLKERRALRFQSAE